MLQFCFDNKESLGDLSGKNVLMVCDPCELRANIFQLAHYHKFVKKIEKKAN